MIGRPFDRTAVIEDLTFLADHGVGASEAAHRCGFNSTKSLDKWMRRWGHVPLLNRLDAQDYLPLNTSGPTRHLRRAS